MKNNPFLETQRLFIRPVRLHDFTELAAIWADPKVMQFIDGSKTQAESKTQLKHWIVDYEKQGYGFIALQCKSNGKIIGNSGFLRQVLDSKVYIELGYCLAQEYWGQGYATEAVTALIHYGFSVLKFPELIAIIREENLASLQVANKIGLRLLKIMAVDGQRSKIFHILRGDYENSS